MTQQCPFCRYVTLSPMAQFCPYDGRRLERPSPCVNGHATLFGWKFCEVCGEDLRRGDRVPSVATPVV